jgi:CRISPR-associated protein Cas2
MLTLISYDIVENRRRTRVMQLLEGVGVRVQRSVFECHLSGSDLVALRKKLLTLIDPNTDSVRCYPLDATATKRIVIVGLGKVTRELTHWLV